MIFKFGLSFTFTSYSYSTSGLSIGLDFWHRLFAFWWDFSDWQIQFKFLHQITNKCLWWYVPLCKYIDGLQ